MKKILYLNSFTVKSCDFGSSDAVGYGITSSDALSQALEKNYHLTKVPESFLTSTHHSAYLAWTLSSYAEVLNHLQQDPPDAIFVFHSFQQFPQELKKMLYHLKLDIPLIGYTHGSHWDPTDTFRHIHCPKLNLSDLANLYCLDAILFVTQTFKEVVIQQIAEYHAPTAKIIAEKSFVVGLPINIPLIDSCKNSNPKKSLSMVFNHAPVPSKRLSVFFRVIEKVLQKVENLNCHMTRYIPPEHEDYAAAFALSQKYPGRFILHKTLAIADYYRLLWDADIQVSTASHESLGVATLEAMYTQNACILPNIGSYPEISAGMTEHLYETEDELLQKIMYYIESPTERISLGKQLAKAAERFSMPHLLPDFLHVLARTIK